MYNGRRTNVFDEIARHLREFCGISEDLASERLHKIKALAGRGGADNVLFDYSGGVYCPETGEMLGSLTAGGKKYEE